MYEDQNKVVVMISVIVLASGCFKHLIPRVRGKQQSQLKLRCGKGWEVMDERRRKWNQ